MESIEILKQKLIEQLDGSFAHKSYKEIMSELPENLINASPPKVDYSFWELLEHIRIAHWDIIEFMTNPNYKGLKWPDEYWPEKHSVATPEMWDHTKQEINRLYDQTKKLLYDNKIDLFAKIPHGSGQHYLREFLLISEHNSYHFGQFIAYRKVLGNLSRKK